MRQRLKKPYLWIIIIAIFLTIQLPYFNKLNDIIRLAFSPATNAMVVSTEKIYDWLKTISSINSLARENIRLKEELHLAESKIAFLENLKSENEQLRKDLEFAETNPQLELIPAEVVSYSPGGFYQALIINRGTKEGVKLGQAVVSSGFLVGIVRKVSELTSEVWLLSNRNVVIPVVLANSQTVGIMKGSIRGLIVDNIPLDSQVAIGEAVVSSSLEGVVPGGIAVGKVEEIISQKEEIFQSVRVNSPINSTQLRLVYLIKNN